MFLHLAYCPDTETETWAKFYEETLARSPVRSILEKVAAVTRTKTESSGLLTTEVALFGALMRMIPFKVSKAALVQSCKMLLSQYKHVCIVTPKAPACVELKTLSL